MTATSTQLATSSRSGMSVSQEESLSKSLSDLVGEDVNMKLEPELRAEFMAEASHRPASQILREVMREFVQRQRQAREYEEFLHGKVASARVQIRAGEYASVDDV